MTLEERIADLERQLRESSQAITPNTDITAMMYQMGRFDLVSMLLAATGLILVAGGVFAFFNFRSIAKRQATEEARTIASQVAEEAVNTYIQIELPDILREYIEFAKGGEETPDESDQIAAAYGREP